MLKPSTGYGRKAARLTTAICLLLSLSQTLFAQAAAVPQREQLLNGLRVLLWPRPGSPDVLVKLRIHSGAAFDLVGKAGEMSLLGDLLFPDRATIEYFTEEMGGRLDVIANYDSITLTMQGRASQFERIIELLRNALLSTQLTPETVARVREARIKIARETAISPPTVADRAIASRLFPEFPYGRPSAGSAEDLGRVDRGDLMLARERFLNSNNATLAIVGNLEKPRIMRTLRQLLGPWRKSEQIVPTSFRQSQPPDERTLIISGPADKTAELRVAMRGLARADPDAMAASVVATIAKHKWEELVPELTKRPIFVRSEAHVLPGVFVMGAAVSSPAVADTIAAARKVLDTLKKTPVTPAELVRARSEIEAEINSQMAKPEGLVDAWLDLDTFHLLAIDDQLAVLRGLSPADIQRVANRLFLDAAVASVIVGDTQQLKTALQGRQQFEVMGEIAAPSPSPKPQNKPVGNINPR
jgi:zinc protease